MSAGLLLALQHGDSLFPSGGFAFSQGLEATAAEAECLGSLDLARFVAAQIRHRWAGFDRVAVIRAHRAGQDLDTLAALDQEIEASSPIEAFRTGSRRNGAALLTSHDRLGTEGAAAYRRLLRQGAALGHLPVVQGLVWRALGLGEAEAAMLSGYVAVTGLATAAIRLGLVGAIEAQRVIAGALALVAAETAPVADHQALAAFLPLADIAACRHGRHGQRLFSN